MADFMSLVNNVIGLNQYTSDMTAKLVQQSGASTSAQQQGNPDNPLAGVESIGGASPPFPQEAATRLQTVQQGFDEAERQRREDIEEEVGAHADAYYAKQGETPEQRVARIESTNQQKQALLEQQNSRTAEFAQYAQSRFAQLSFSDPDYQTKYQALADELRQQESQINGEHMTALLKVGLPPELHGMVDQKVAGYQALQASHKNQIEGSHDYQQIKQFQEQQQEYAKRLRESIAAQNPASAATDPATQIDRLRQYAQQQVRGFLG